MSKFVLTASSTVDLPLEYFEKQKIPYVCFHYMMDGIEYPDDLGQTISFEDFYRKIEAGAMPTTSQVSVGQFIDFCEPFLKEGLDI
ncbi:MAG TPA: DegV family protein, partial [Firmicutes bacterium]|nr:DegV family protein [Bacillota bacterium]